VRIGKNKIRTTWLFLLAAGTGIAMFVSAWNSFLSGKEKIYISLSFLVLFLIVLVILYFQFSQLFSILNDVWDPDDEQINHTPAEPNSPSLEMDNSRDTNFGLLKGVFNKPDMKSIGEKLLKNLAKEFDIVQGVVFVLNPQTSKYSAAASFALAFDNMPPDFAQGEGIPGQAAADNKILVIPNLPESFSPVISGLGRAKARYLYVIPLVYEKKTNAVVEISCFKEIEENRLSQLNQLMREGGSKISSVLATETK
jgi:hypothetical protein